MNKRDREKGKEETQRRTKRNTKDQIIQTIS
jgi:hypothetical protein